MSSQKLSDSEFNSLVVKKLTEGDIVHKVFLKPIEIMLKTSKVKIPKDSEYSQIEDTKPAASAGSLPQGLLIALKRETFYDNSYIPTVIRPLDMSEAKTKHMKASNTDNLISFLKASAQVNQDKKFDRGNSDSDSEKIVLTQPQNKMELAICVCMYSQNKTMLKDTLKGIEDNISKIVSKGVQPDSIGVFVIMDGIEKVDSSVINYFEELQRESFIFLGENNNESYTEDDINKQIKNQGKESSKIVEKNMNNFLFNQSEIKDRQERRFSTVLSYYKDFKKLKEEVIYLRKNLKSIPYIYDKLPQIVQSNYFYPLAREHKLKTAKNSEQRRQFDKLSNQDIINEYAFDSQKSKVIGFEAINRALQYFDQYFETRDSLAYLGSFRKKIYVPKYAQKPKDANDVNSHTYLAEEETEDGHIRQMNLFMCVKYKNSGKLSSHNWFFNGFCKEFNPSYSILLDVGLKPKSDALYKMYYHMKQNSNVGGVCGYMSLKIERVGDQEKVKKEDADWLSRFVLNFVDIQKAQQMEYHLAHILDKPFESAFKFIHVLPGAFSGYSMKALQPEGSEDKLLKHYFKSIDEKMSEYTIKPSDITFSHALFRVIFPEFLYDLFFGVDPESEEQMLYNQNIYLAEDRILCMQIHKNGKNLVFLPDSYAEVDPIKNVVGMMGQRKRWINGSYFAFEKVKTQKADFERQNKTCEFLLTLQIIYLNFINIMGYFAPSLFYFTLHISMVAFKIDVLGQIIRPIFDKPDTYNAVLNFFVYTIDLIYALVIGGVIFYSLNSPANRPLFKPLVYFISTILGIMSIIIFLVLLIDMIRGLASDTEFLLQIKLIVDQIPGGQSVLTAYRYVIVGMFGIYIVPVMLYSFLYANMQPLAEIIKSSVSFIFYSPSYFVLLNIYALCRIDDISWGTKGLESSNSKQSKLQEKWKMIKLIHVVKFVVWNVAASVVLLSYAELPIPRFYITFVLMMLIILTLLFKIIIGMCYLVVHRIQNCCGDSNKTIDPKSSKLALIISQLRNEVIDETSKRANEVQVEIKQAQRKGNGFSVIQAMSKIAVNPKKLEKDRIKFAQDNASRSVIFRKNPQKAAAEGVK